MTVCVFGLWHLGSVTAACLAGHHDIVAIDPDAQNVARLNTARAPISEPGLDDLIRAGLDRKSLRFSSALSDAARADLVWVTFDTPVDDADQADSAYVERQIASLIPHLAADTLILISSQLPAGTTARLESRHHRRFAYSPENLRLGKAISVFRNPGRIVAGVRTPEDRAQLEPFLAPICENILWMSVESAEMSKHALNAFLATSVVFMNELASICERAGADAKQVEQALKSDERIGPRAYLSPGAAFAGGTLARDVSFLADRSALFSAIRSANDAHKSWPRRKLEEMLGDLREKRIALLGLTYKPGTDTLRRSAAVELAEWLVARGAVVTAFDPAIHSADLKVTLAKSAFDALSGADAVVIATEWPEFRTLVRDEILSAMRTPVVLDANHFLRLDTSPPIRYAAVGVPL